MSTVLWANILKDGVVEADDADNYALFKFTGKLDKLCKKAKIKEFSSLLDDTDLKFNLSNEELPEGMESTNEVMAKTGNWAEGQDALEILKVLKEVVSNRNIRFGIFSDHSKDILEELDETIKIAEKAAKQGLKFNFSVVM